MSEILTPEEYEREWWDILQTRSRGYDCFDEVNPETKATLLAHDAALRLALETATQRVAKLERQRSEFDCRYAGPYAETSGVHCPLGQPCQSCQLVAAERERDDNANVILEQNKLWADRCEVAERERDDIAAWAESWMKRVAAAERERNEWKQIHAATAAELASERERRVIAQEALSRPAPPADAATDDNGYPPTLADARMHVERLTRSLSQPHSADERFFAINEARTWLAKTAAAKADAANCPPYPWTWERVARRVGEEFARSGPDDYYDFGPAEWQDWMLARIYAMRPPADAATEAVREAAERLARHVLDVPMSMRGMGAVPHAEAIKREGLAADLLAALSPAPAPSAKEE